jgi:glycosyltransferase involved in cell wall biosynthesis
LFQLASESTQQVSVVFTCKGRLDFLRESLPAVVAQQGTAAFDITVVDYGCPDGTFMWLHNEHPGVRAVLVKDCTEFFNLSRARNIGAMASKSPLIAFCDADVTPGPLWLQTMVDQLREPQVVMTHPQWRRGGCGICLVRRKTFMDIRGFDEELEGWGYEDIDFRNRATTAGVVATYSPGLFSVRRHSVSARVRFYRDKQVAGGIPVTNHRNKRRVQLRHGLPNPDGFGQGELMIWPNH